MALTFDEGGDPIGVEVNIPDSPLSADEVRRAPLRLLGHGRPRSLEALLRRGRLPLDGAPLAPNAGGDAAPFAPGGAAQRAGRRREGPGLPQAAARLAHRAAVLRGAPRAGPDRASGAQRRPLGLRVLLVASAGADRRGARRPGQGAGGRPPRRAGGPLGGGRGELAWGAVQAPGSAGAGPAAWGADLLHPGRLGGRRRRRG
jgi:hypothetical protein